MTQKLNYYEQNSGYPPFYQYPWFIHDLDLSRNAKDIYALMTDRVRASIVNDWNDEGKIYIIYPEAELAEKNHTSIKTVQRAIKELKEKGFIESKKLGQCKPNRIYVKYPDNVKLVKKVHAPAQSSDGTDLSFQERSDMSVPERTEMSYIVKNTTVNSNKNKNRFHNFEQRVYDDAFYKKLEEKLFNN